MGGRKYQSRYGRMPKYAPKTVPIIKIFEQPGTETWIVPQDDKNGIVLMRRNTDPLTQLRCNLVKWTAWPDGDRWFPMSQPEADQKRGFAYDLWLNFFFDMMTAAKDTRLVIDKSALPPDQRRLDPLEDIYIAGGNAQQAVAYLQRPQIDPSIPMVGDILDRVGQGIRGTKDFMQKNYTRGGSNAFQDLLNTMQARQRLSAMILETGALSQIYEHVLCYMQQLVPESGLDLARPRYDASQGKLLMERKTITLQDLRHGYNIMLDTSERRMLGGMSDQMRLQLWKELVVREDTIREEVNRLLPLPDTVIRRSFRNREELDRMQSEDRDMRLMGQMAGMEVPPPPGAEAVEAQAGGMV